MTALAPRRLRTETPPTRRGPGAVFLDRDGVLNDTPDGTGAGSPRRVDDVHLAAGAQVAVDRLRRAGYLLVVVTNQPDVARGLLHEADALAITHAVADPLDLDDGYVCVHDTADGCPCRKPQPGLLTAAASDWRISLTQSWLIGDRWVDIAAGRAAGVRTALIERPYNNDPSGGISPPPGLAPDVAVVSLDDAVTTITGSAA